MQARSERKIWPQYENAQPCMNHEDFAYRDHIKLLEEVFGECLPLLFAIAPNCSIYLPVNDALILYNNNATSGNLTPLSANSGSLIKKVFALQGKSSTRRGNLLIL